MIEYDSKHNLLTIKRVNLPDIPEHDVIDDIKSSYAKYKEVGGNVEADVKFLFDAIVKAAKIDPLKVTTRVGPLHSSINSYGVKPTDMYYPVLVTLEANGYTSPEIELFHIPYMDSRGVLNMDSSLKVLVNFLSASEDVSYEASTTPSGEPKRKLNIYLGERNLPITINKTNKVIMKIGKGTAMPVEQIILTMLAAESDGLNLSEEQLHAPLKVIHNSMLNYKSSVCDDLVSATAIDNCQAIDTVLLSSNYTVSRTARHNLNLALQLDRAVGYTLSRDVHDDKTGELLLRAETVLTGKDIAMLKKHLVWKIYVKCRPLLKGMKLANPIDISIYEGMKVGKYIKSKVGASLHGASYVPKGVGISRDREYTPEELASYLCTTEEFHNILNDDIAEYLYDKGATEPLQVIKTINGVQDIIDIEMDMEIITNQTFLDSDIHPGGSTDKWWVYDKHGNLVEQSSCMDMAFLPTRRNTSGIAIDGRDNGRGYYCFNGDRLNSRDLLALYSVAGWYITSPESRIFLNKDASLLKNIQLFNEVFSTEMRKAAIAFAAKIKNVARTKLIGPALPVLQSGDLGGFRSTLRETLNGSGCLKTADMMNPASILADVSNITTHVMDTNAISENQRLITLPFYGRICPYETPASSKIGLVNHKANGCKIVDGVIYTAFRKVHKEGTRIYIKPDEEPVWLAPKEQAVYKVCDCLSVPMSSSGIIDGNSYVLAMIPNDKTTGDVTTVESIPARELDYISYTPEQHCSATALLMPFLGADDPARISFGLSMQKQTIFCQENEKPRVLTRQYRDMFKSMPFYTVVAEQDGVVENITDAYISVRYDATASSSSGRIATFKSTGEAINVCQLYVGQKIPANAEIITNIAEGAENFEVILAPFDCEVTALDDVNGYIAIRETAMNRRPPITKIPCASVTINGQSVTFTNYDKAPGERFVAGEVLAHASIIKDGFYAPARNVLVAYIPTGYNYEDAVDMSANCASHYTSISAHKQEEYGKARRDTPYECNVERSYVHDGMLLASFVPRSAIKADGNNAKPMPIRQIDAHNVSGYVYSHYSEENPQSKNGSRVYKFTLLSFNNEKPGDKMAGRHGNKGVCARLTSNAQMPMLKNGKIVDVCLNPCGVPSRMNLGQNLEAHLGFIAELFDTYIISDSFNGASLDDISHLMSYAYDIANSDPSKWKDITVQYGVPVNFVDHLMSKIDHIKEWEGAFNKDGTAEMWDPSTREWFEYPIAFGYSYYLKLEQEVDEKVHSREGATSETYNEASQQPQQGRAHGGGQKMGEMELVTLAAYGATGILDECMNEKSDNVGRRFELTSNALGNPVNVPREFCTPRANENLRYLLEAMGVYTDIIGSEDNIFSIETSHLERRPVYSGHTATSAAREAACEENKKMETDVDSAISKFSFRRGGNK